MVFLPPVNFLISLPYKYYSSFSIKSTKILQKCKLNPRQRNHGISATSQSYTGGNGDATVQDTG